MKDTKPRAPTPNQSKLRRFVHDNGLTLAVMFLLFVPSMIGQSVTGQRVYNAEQVSHQQTTIGYVDYLTTGHFVEATFENWESEFLQMGVYVLLTVWLRQRGSSESKSPNKPEHVDENPRDHKNDSSAPWPVRRGGLLLFLYKNSLCIAFFALFAASFSLHAFGGAREYSAEQVAHGGQDVSVFGYVTTSQFWFESFQNWQSEFLSIAAIVVLSIFLRQQGSPESKPVAAPHGQTGTE